MLKKIDKVIIFILSFNLLVTFYCFAQEGSSQEKIIPYYPEKESLTSEEKEFQSVKKSVENRLFARMDFLALKAFREGDREICNQLRYKRDIEECKEEFDGNTFAEYFAKGKCNKLEHLRGGFIGSKRVCQALSKNNCFTLKGYHKMLCEAILKRDKELCRKAINTPEFISQNGCLNDNAHEEIINIHYGFKTNRDQVCDQFSSKAFSESRRLRCKFLFAKNPEMFQKRLIEDLAYFVYVKEHKKEKIFCNKIKDPVIKKACYNRDIIDLRDFFSR